jgi:uncharacterized RDD family membrane protein YckC
VGGMILDEELVVKRRKITDVFERRTVSRRERNEFGEWEYVQREFLHRKPLQTLSSGFRLLHFILDFYGVVFLANIFLVFVGRYFPPALAAFFPLICLALHYIFGELYLQKTLGKFVTGSIVVNEYGEPPDARTVILRTLIRFIPFEPFSFWGSSDGWHDKWTKTYVMKRKEVERVKDLLRYAVETEVPAS